MNIRVSYSEIDHAAAQLSAGREEMTHRLHTLQRHIESLVSSGFVTDQASGRFHEAYSRYTASASQMVAELTEIESFLRHTAAAMQELDQHIAARVQS